MDFESRLTRMSVSRFLDENPPMGRAECDAEQYPSLPNLSQTSTIFLFVFELSEWRKSRNNGTLDYW